MGPLTRVNRCRQEPGPAFSFVNPVLQQTRRSKITRCVANLMSLAHKPRQFIVVFAEDPQHGAGIALAGISVSQPLMTNDIADRSKRGLSYLPCSLRDCVGCFE